jgi:2-polyprenyl-3-methyl-5-hydroxy-6-metoxy-1,4-benzoquinol methylase
LDETQKVQVMNSPGWDNFWKDQQQSFDRIMRISTTYFSNQLIKLIGIKKTDKILDYGCGPGFLIDCICDETETSPSGVDINDFYLKQCSTNHPESQFVKITTDSNINRNIFVEHFGTTKFDLIILLSVSQYLKGQKELEDVIRLLSAYLTEQGKIIVADVIDPSSSPYRDALSLLIYCIKKRELISYVRFMFFLFSSSYRSLSKSVKLLTFSQDAIFQIAQNNSLTCREIQGMTIHATRKNYLFKKNPVRK